MFAAGPRRPQCPSYTVMRRGGRESLRDWAVSCFTGWLAKPGHQGLLGAGSRRAPAVLALPCSLCVLTPLPGCRIDSRWEGSKKSPQERDLVFQLNCQCRENLGGSVECSPWEDSKEGGTQLPKRSFCALPSLLSSNQ